MSQAGRKSGATNAYRGLTPTEFVRKLEKLKSAVDLAVDDSPQVFVGVGMVSFLQGLVDHMLALAGPGGEGSLAWFSELCEAIDELEWGSSAQRISLRLVANRMMTETDARSRTEAEKEVLRAVKSKAPEPKRQEVAQSNITIGDQLSTLSPELFTVKGDE